MSSGIYCLPFQIIQMSFILIPNTKYIGAVDHNVIIDYVRLMSVCRSCLIFTGREDTTPGSHRPNIYMQCIGSMYSITNALRMHS